MCCNWRATKFTARASDIQELLRLAGADQELMMICSPAAVRAQGRDAFGCWRRMELQSRSVKVVGRERKVRACHSNASWQTEAGPRRDIYHEHILPNP